jgi:hypothetical protein
MKLVLVRYFIVWWNVSNISDEFIASVFKAVASGMILKMRQWFYSETSTEFTGV